MERPEPKLRVCQIERGRGFSEIITHRGGAGLLLRPAPIWRPSGRGPRRRSPPSPLWRNGSTRWRPSGRGLGGVDGLEPPKGRAGAAYKPSFWHLRASAAPLPRLGARRGATLGGVATPRHPVVGWGSLHEPPNTGSTLMTRLSVIRWLTNRLFGVGRHEGGGRVRFGGREIGIAAGRWCVACAGVTKAV